MRIGIPTAGFFHDYKSFIEHIKKSTKAELVYSPDTDEKILELGKSSTPDEACISVKAFVGKILYLLEHCDYVAVPRIMKTSYGEPLCPKLRGVPDMLPPSIDRKKLLFTDAMDLSRPWILRKELIKEWRRAGTRDRHIKKMITTAMEKQWKSTARSGMETEYGEELDIFSEVPVRVMLSGHTYTLEDPYVNMHLIDKLEQMDVIVIRQDSVSRHDKVKAVESITNIKRPYWTSLIDVVGSAVWVAQNSKIDGIIYVSAFSCGIDSVAIEMLEKAGLGLPILVVKADEHRGDEGLQTRLEAFEDVLRRQRQVFPL